jgi:Ala-tRNA(Pro) deacylase
MSMKHFLQRRRVPFEVLAHLQAFDAQHLAHALHTPGQEVAKTVLLRIDRGERYVVAVLPSTHMVDFEKLSAFLGDAVVELATEHEIAERCPDCEFGVVPPFGSHYGAQTIVDTALTRDEHISFESDSFSEAIRMKYADFHSYECPLVVDFARRVELPRWPRSVQHR